MKMLVLVCICTLILTALTQGFQTDVTVPGQIKPVSTVTVNCSFDRSYEQTSLVFIYNSTKGLVYYHDYLDGSGGPGDDYTDMVSNPQAKGGWFSIDFTPHACYKDNKFECNVYDWNWEIGKGSASFLIALPEIPQPRIFINGVCKSCVEDEAERTVRLSKAEDGNATLVCHITGVLPEVELTLDYPFNKPGGDTSLEDPETCTYTQTSSAEAHVYRETHVGCWAKSEIGRTRSRSVILIPYRGVELQLPEEMNKDSSVTLNCTYDLSQDLARVVVIWNNTGHNIYTHLFFLDKGEIGQGFKDLVSNPRLGEGWVAIDFLMPACYWDFAFGCTVVQTGGGTYGFDRRTFKQVYRLTN